MLVDLTVAIEVGVVLASILFMHRMAEAVAIQSHTQLIEEDIDDFTRNGGDAYTRRIGLPKGVEVFELRGPFFFGVANRLGEILDRIGQTPKVFIVLMRDVPLIDATGVRALQDFIARCRRDQTEVVLAELQRSVSDTLKQMRILDGGVSLADSYDAALAEFSANMNLAT